MRTSCNDRRRSTARGGFTLLELLIVITIIAVLAAILSPVVSKVRRQAQIAHTQQEISQISSAIEAYHVDHGAYPGPIGNADFKPSGTFTLGAFNVTMSENLMLGLAGGLTLTNKVDLTEIGKGPLNIASNPSAQTRSRAYMDPQPGSLSQAQPWTDYGQVGPGGKDSQIPEFLDRFPNTAPGNSNVFGMPIIYLRATVGNTAVTLGGKNKAQYDVNMMKPYIKGFKVNEPQKNSSGTLDYASWEEYFQHPSIPNVPKGYNAYLLISPGPDGFYGTKDDIINVGN